ncbi:STELLO glycosyltransferase family protein [Paludibaculum fermentans]|uniref:STELLO glycosyltransferase family protein n=1 Tax=Paludibaculum fermentans TaxID=1473598 RepID=UPI003EBAB816
MNNARWIVVTTINPPTETVRRLVDLCPEWQILVVGDRKTPPDWHYPGVRFLSVDEQKTLNFALAESSPYNHYARKNLGYLYAIAHGAEVLLETDDDNLPYDWYPGSVTPEVLARRVESTGWQNVYRHFSTARIWPRGFPLELVNESLRTDSSLSAPSAQNCAIQQFLADENPDVDAVYRLTAEGDIFFRGEDIALESGSWCPFNSQNTLWWPEAFTYLYLPCSATFRMTDIWRSFVAQVCLYASGGRLAFRGANMFQRRNDHSLIRDFADEVSGYLNNMAIMEKLSRLQLAGFDPAHQLYACYEEMTTAGYLRPEELQLARFWLDDLHSARNSALASREGTPLLR